MDALRLSELRLSEDSIEAKGGSGDADIDFEEDPTGGQVEEDHIAEKKRDNQNVEGQCVIEPQKRALAIIQTPDHDPPTRWFDNDTDAAAFVTAVGKANDVAANVVGERNTSRVLYRFLSTVFELRYLRKEEKDEEFPRLSLQERRNRHLQAVIEASAFARDFGPHLARHVTLMLLCTRRSLKKPQKGPNGSSDVSEMIDKLLLWFEQNDAADMDHFERLHPWLKNLGAHTGNSPMLSTLFNAYERD